MATRETCLPFDPNEPDERTEYSSRSEFGSHQLRIEDGASLSVGGPTDIVRHAGERMATLDACILHSTQKKLTFAKIRRRQIPFHGRTPQRALRRVVFTHNES